MLFGRARELEQLPTLLRSPAERADPAALAIVGPFGSGAANRHPVSGELAHYRNYHPPRGLPELVRVDGAAGPWKRPSRAARVFAASTHTRSVTGPCDGPIMSVDVVGEKVWPWRPKTW